MTDKETQDRHDFLDKALNEYYRLKHLRTMSELPINEIKSTLGCLSILFVPIMRYMTDQALKPEEAKRDYANLKDKAQNILNSENVRKDVRSAFEELSKKEIVTEEIFVKVFAKALSDDSLRRQLDIPLDPVLFAIIGHDIFKIGIREYCGGNS